MIERWTAGAAEDYRWFRKRDLKVAQRIDRLIEDIKRRPFAGIGKPEPLRGSCKSCSADTTTDATAAARSCARGASRRSCCPGLRVVAADVFQRH
jgi:toxin YoeB